MDPQNIQHSTQTESTNNLSQTWTLYEHVKSTEDNYDSSITRIADISTVEKFWQVFNRYPAPGKLFSNMVFKNLFNSKEIAALSFFRDGVEPKWEDPENLKGAEVSKRMFVGLDEIDRDWMTVLVSCVSDMDPSVTGVRVVDASSLKKVGNTCVMEFKLLYRLEIWFTDCEKRLDIEEYCRKNLNIEDPRHMHYKEHKPE